MGAAPGVVQVVVRILRDLAVDLPEEVGITRPPAVEALLEVADEKGGPAGFLNAIEAHDGLEVVLEDEVLPRACVLEFVEEPVLDAAVEAVVDVELAFGLEEQGDVIAEGQVAALTDLAFVDLLVAGEQLVDGMGLVLFDTKGEPEGVTGQGAQVVAGLGREGDGFGVCSVGVGCRPGLAVFAESDL